MVAAGQHSKRVSVAACRFLQALNSGSLSLVQAVHGTSPDSRYEGKELYKGFVTV